MIDDQAVAAAVALVGRTGAADLEIGYLDDDVPSEVARWYAKARYGGQIVTVEDQAGPLEAVEGLAFRLIDGGICTRCNRQISRTLADDRCVWTRDGSEWVRGCADSHPDSGMVPTKRKLASALQRAGCPTPMVEAALMGYYDDFESALPAPINQLVADLRTLGLEALAQEAIDGKFDGTREESEAWAKSADGQAAFAELLGGNRAQRRARKRRR